MTGQTRRAVFVTLLAVVLTSSGSHARSVSRHEHGRSAVFESVSTDEPWAGDYVRVNSTTLDTLNFTGTGTEIP